MRIEKTQMVKDIAEMFNNSVFLYFMNYKGLTVSEISTLRNSLAEHDAECHVFKNRLIKKAAEANEATTLAELTLTGDTAVVMGQGDPGAVAKVLDEFFKSHEDIAAKGGFLDGALLSEADVKSIADLPPKEVLQSQLIGVIQAPARNLASLLNNKLSEIVNVVKAYQNKLENK